MSAEDIAAQVETIEQTIHPGDPLLGHHPFQVPPPPPKAEDIAAIAERLREAAEKQQAAHHWRSKSGRPWGPRVKSDLCAICGRTPDAHLAEKTTPAGVLVKAETILALLDALTQAEAREGKLREENARLTEAVRILQDNFPRTVAAPMDRAALICARYWGSDGTLCSTHNRRFSSPTETRCEARALLAPAEGGQS